MAFGFGFNKNKSEASSDSSSQSTNVAASSGESQNTSFSNTDAGSSFGNQSSTGVWEGQKPFLKRGYEGAQKLYDQGPYQYFGGGVNPLNSYQQQAIDNRFRRGVEGSPQERAFGDTLLRLLQGDQGPDVSGVQQTLAGYERAGGAGLDSLQQQIAGGENPYLDRTFDAAADRVGRKFNEYVVPGVNTTFGGAGRAGSAAHERAVTGAGRDFGETLGDLGAQIYGGAYESDANRRLSGAQNLASLGLGAGQARGNIGLQKYGAQTQRQLGAGALVPELSGLEVQNLNLQQEAGDRLRQQQDLELQDRADKFYYNQDAPNQALQRFIQSIGGAISTSQSSGGGSSFSTGRAGSQGTSANRSLSVGQSSSTGKSRAKGKGSGFNIGAS